MDSNQRTGVILAFFVVVLAVTGWLILRADGHDKQHTQLEIAKTCAEHDRAYTIVGRGDNGQVIMGCR